MADINYEEKYNEPSLKVGNRFLDLSNKRFGKLSVIKVFGKDKTGKYLWECMCDCGKTSVVLSSNLVRENTKSCGCEKIGIGEVTKKHGMSKTRLFKIWVGMRKRCLNKNCKSYKHYGGRGIKVHPRWEVFDNFYEDVISSYKEDLSLDRYPDVNGDYSPSNFRWATSKSQNNNRRNNTYIELDGVKKTIAEWSTVSSIPPSNISYRIRNGWSARDAVYKPILGDKNLKSISKYLIV